MSFLNKCISTMTSPSDKCGSGISEEDLQNHFLLLFELCFVFKKVKEYLDTGSFGSVCLKTVLEKRIRDRVRFQNILKINEGIEKLNSIIDIISSEKKDIDGLLKLLSDLYLSSLEKISFKFNLGSMSLEHLIYFFSINMFLYSYGVYKDGVHSSEILKNIYDIIDSVKKLNYVNFLLLEYYLYSYIAHFMYGQGNALTTTKGLSILPFFGGKKCTQEIKDKFEIFETACVEGISCIKALKEVYTDSSVILVEKGGVEKGGNEGDYAIWMSNLFPPRFSLDYFERDIMEALKTWHSDEIPNDHLVCIDRMVNQKISQIKSMLPDHETATPGT